MSEEDIAVFSEKRTLRPVLTHASYLINLASPVAELRARSIDCFVGELGRSRALGLEYVVTHPGSFTSTSEAVGLQRIVAAALKAHRARLSHPVGDRDFAHVHSGGDLFHHLDRARGAGHDPAPQ